MTGATDWSIFFYLGAGLGILLIGCGILIVSLRLAGLLSKATTTLDEVDRQIAAIAPPIIRTLSHVGGIADTADETLARLGTVVGAVEGLAGGVAKSAGVAQNAVTPAVVNFGAALTSLSAKFRTIVRGRSTVDTTSDLHVDV